MHLWTGSLWKSLCPCAHCLLRHNVYLLHDPCLLAAAQDVITTPVAQERERMSSQCVNILYTYRKFCATASSSGQLILPEALKLLPLYTMGMSTVTCDLHSSASMQTWFVDQLSIFQTRKQCFVFTCSNILWDLLQIADFIFCMDRSFDQKCRSAHRCADWWEIILAYPSCFIVRIFGHSVGLPTDV